MSNVPLYRVQRLDPVKPRRDDFKCGSQELTESSASWQPGMNPHQTSEITVCL
jgi:hypothetical protein